MDFHAELLTDKERTFFSVIMPIHESFKQNGNMNIQEKRVEEQKMK